MTKAEKAVIGALGGLSAVLVKFLGQDYNLIVLNAGNLSEAQISAFQIGYGILTPILMFLGAFIAYLTDETKPIKIVALAIAAPAMITTWAGGAKSSLPVTAGVSIMSSAYAFDPEEPSNTTEAVNASSFEKIKQGIGIFFGYGKEPKKYWVIVGSYTDKSVAQAHADKINQEDIKMNAWVGIKVPPNDYYPVIVGGYNYLSEAKLLKQSALSLSAIDGAYLSSGAKR